jgi:hypothetical protein
MKFWGIEWKVTYYTGMFALMWGFVRKWIDNFAIDHFKIFLSSLKQCCLIEMLCPPIEGCPGEGKSSSRRSGRISNILHKYAHWFIPSHTKLSNRLWKVQNTYFFNVLKWVSYGRFTFLRRHKIYILLFLYNRRNVIKITIYNKILVCSLFIRKCYSVCNKNFLSRLRGFPITHPHGEASVGELRSLPLSLRDETESPSEDPHPRGFQYFGREWGGNLPYWPDQADPLSRRGQKSSVLYRLLCIFGRLIKALRGLEHPQGALTPISVLFP